MESVYAPINLVELRVEQSHLVWNRERTAIKISRVHQHHSFLLYQHMKSFQS